MKKIVTRVALLLVALSMLLSCFGCRNVSVPQTSSSPIYYQLTIDKIKYEYGEEITLEFIFQPNNNNGIPKKDGYLYCAKLAESPYYEIIGANEVYTDGSENTKPIVSGKRAFYYKAVFKIKVTHEFDEKVFVNVLVKCVDNDYLTELVNNYATNGMNMYVGDSEFPFSTVKNYFGFITDSEGIKFVSCLDKNL